MQVKSYYAEAIPVIAEKNYLPALSQLHAGGLGKEAAGSAIFALCDGLREPWSILELQSRKGTINIYKTGEDAYQGYLVRHGEALRRVRDYSHAIACAHRCSCDF